MIDWDITNVKVWELVHWNGLLRRSQEDSTNQRLSIGVSFRFDIPMTLWINMVYVCVNLGIFHIDEWRWNKTYPHAISRHMVWRTGSQDRYRICQLYKAVGVRSQADSWQISQLWFNHREWSRDRSLQVPNCEAQWLHELGPRPLRGAVDSVRGKVGFFFWVCHEPMPWILSI